VVCRLSNDVPTAMAGALNDLASACTDPHGTIATISVLSSDRIVYLNQTCAALCAVSLQHSGANHATRSRLMIALAPLERALPILCTAASRAILERCASGSLNTDRSSVHIASHLLSFGAGLIQTFGWLTPAFCFLNVKL
jgi:hypothetical protein